MPLTNSLSSLLPAPKRSSKVKGNPSGPDQAIIRLFDKDEISKDEAILENARDAHGKTVSFESFLPLRHKFPNIELPLASPSEIQHALDITKAVFDKIVAQKLQPQGTSVSNASSNPNMKKIEYKIPSGDADGRTRHLEIFDQQVDPLQPKLFKTKKMVAPPTDEPFAPVLHKSDEATVQISKEERDQWNIPSAISNWKNPNGYTIALEKRVASDGRYSKESVGPHNMSNKFAELSEALDVAERKAREDVKMRGEAKRMLAEQDAKEKDDKLRRMALRAREERLKGKIDTGVNVEDRGQQIREENKKERLIQLEKELKKSKMGTADRLRALAASQGREISDKVILGAAKASDTSGLQYDSRLYAKAAAASSQKSSDQVYDNPLFLQERLNTMYRPNFSQISEALVDSSGQTHNGTADSEALGLKRAREGPVEFTEAEETSHSEGAVLHSTKKSRSN